jgi:hypothetical protein
MCMKRNETRAKTQATNAFIPSLLAPTNRAKTCEMLASSYVYFAKIAWNLYYSHVLTRHKTAKLQQRHHVQCTHNNNNGASLFLLAPIRTVPCIAHTMLGIYHFMLMLCRAAHEFKLLEHSRLTDRMTLSLKVPHCCARFEG